MIAPAAMAALSLGIGAASAVVEHIGLQRQADAQNRFYEENMRNANAAASIEKANAELRLQQEQEAASARVFEARLEGQKARSTARVAAGEAGVSGVSVDALIADYYGQEGRNVSAIQHNFENQRGAFDMELDSIELRRVSRINSVQRAAPPSFLTTALKIGSAGLGAGTYYQRATSNYRAEV